MASTSNESESSANMIEQFCSITGADENTARQMLEACGGNLEMAINMHVDTQSSIQEPVHSSTMAAATTSTDSDDVRPPIPPVRAVLVEEGYSFGFRSRRRPPPSVLYGLRDFQAEAKWQEELATMPDGYSVQKKTTLEDLFRPPLDLMHRGTFESARDMGQSMNRWLLVNIQNVQEFACQVLNRDVWSNPAVKSIVSEHFVFWQVYIDSQEGQRYSQFYKVSDFPYVAILDPRTGENLIVWNKIDSVSFCDLVTEFLSDHPSPDGSLPTIPPKKKIKTDALMEDSEESQLKAAIEMSLREANSAMNRSKQENNSHNSDEECSELETFDSDSDSIQNYWSADSNKQVDSDMADMSGSKEEEVENCSTSTKGFCNSNGNNNNNNVMMNDKDTSSEGGSASNQKGTQEKISQWTDFIGSEDDPKSELMIRFPDGTRQQMSFPCSSKLQALILYAASQGYAQEKYELVTNFPRQNLCVLPSTLTLKEAGLFPRETIFVQLRHS